MTENSVKTDERVSGEQMSGESARKARKNKKRRRWRITPWKKTALWFCLFFLLLAGALHMFRVFRSSGFEDQNEASRWGNDAAYAQVSAFLPSENAMKQEEIMQLEYEINMALAQDSIKVASDKEGARLWQDCYAGMGTLPITANKQTVQAEAVGTGGEFFMFHPLILSSGSYYSSSSIMKDEILLDQQTAWRLFGSFDVVGRTVRVDDTNLRIAGVFKKEEGSIYEEAGMPDCLVFVQYRTLVKYGTSGASGSDGQDDSSSDANAQGRLSIPTNAKEWENTSPNAQGRENVNVPHTAAAPMRKAQDIRIPFSGRGVDEAVDVGADTAADDGSFGSDAGGADTGGFDDAGPEGSGTGSEDTGDNGSFDDSDGGTGTGGSGTDGTGGSGTGGTSGTGAGGTGTGTGTNTPGASQYIGTGNTAYKDKGKITIYEIVMPNPVDGYAAGKVKQALGEETPAIIVDNTNRFGYASLWRDLRDFALAGMRTREIRLPYWENAARGFEAIFALLFLAECILIGLTALLLIWMIIHYIRHKTWTLIGNLRAVENGIYERQSRKRYPEYYEEKEREAAGGDEKGGTE